MPPISHRRSPGNARRGATARREQASECYALLSEALDKYDPTKAASPVPLALKVLEDRGKRRGNQ